jgi:hypothetical protein
VKRIHVKRAVVVCYGGDGGRDQPANRTNAKIGVFGRLRKAKIADNRIKSHKRTESRLDVSVGQDVFAYQENVPVHQDKEASSSSLPAPNNEEQ